MEKSVYNIIVMSDSHSDIHPKFYSKLKNIDFIIHCGDISEMDIIYELEEYAPVIAVAGNVESNETDDRYPVKLIHKIGQLKIFITHSFSYNENYFYEKINGTEERDIKLVLFGHTHKPYKKKYKGITFFNPGSIGPPRYKFLPSYGFLKIYEDGKFSIKHKKIYDTVLMKRFYLGS
jgi:uncharacterized protein